MLTFYFIEGVKKRAGRNAHTAAMFDLVDRPNQLAVCMVGLRPEMLCVRSSLRQPSSHGKQPDRSASHSDLMFIKIQ